MHTAIPGFTVSMVITNPLAASYLWVRFLGIDFQEP